MNPPRKLVCKIILGACHTGLGARTAANIATVERWARGIGCDAIQIEGRRGWAKVYTDYEEVYTTFQKELSDE